MIEVDSLTYTYRGMSQPAISQINFDISPGEIFGFLGPSGAGKSTTQKILIGLLRNYSGRASVLGGEVRHLKPSFYERIGVSFEFPNHFLKLTARENLDYFGRLYSAPTRPAQELLEFVDLAQDGDLLVSQFSKGMKNRLSVARALLNNAELLFLDEPTAGLDPINARRIRDLIRVQAEAGKTIFLTTHDMSVADALCHRVAFINEGQIRLVDRPSNLKLQYGKPTLRVEFELNGEQASREFPLRGLADNQDFASALRELPIRTIHSQEATLEEVFIQVTGRKLS